MTHPAETARRGMMGFPCEAQADPSAAWRAAVAADSPSPRTLYIHIPFCRSRCPFCPFYLLPGEEAELRRYLPLLRRELRDAAPDLGRHPVNAVYIGGGTPSDLAGEDLAALLDILHREYRLAADCEITVEGRIDGFDPEKVRLLAGHGVNRLSIGVQTFDSALRQRLGRRSDRDFILKRLAELSGQNLLALVVDLLYALPGQSMEQWREDLRLLTGHTCLSGVDLYRLRVSEKLPLARDIEEGRMPRPPDEEAAFAMYLAGVEHLERAGAVRLSAVHFALDARERNLNNTVSSVKNVCLPFGIKAAGRLSGYRFIQHTDPGPYRAAVEAGFKPLRDAGRLPADFAAAGVLAGQIYRPRHIAPGLVAQAAPPTLRRSVEAALERALEPWTARGYLLPPVQGIYKLTERACFAHRAMASDLMEQIAGVFS